MFCWCEWDIVCVARLLLGRASERYKLATVHRVPVNFSHSYIGKTNVLATETEYNVR